MGVVQQPVDCRGREGLWHELVESGRVQVRGHRDGPFLVGGIDEPIRAISGVSSDREQPDVIDDDEIGAEDAGHDAGDWCPCLRRCRGRGCSIRTRS